MWKLEFLAILRAVFQTSFGHVYTLNAGNSFSMRELKFSLANTQHCQWTTFICIRNTHNFKTARFASRSYVLL